MLGCTTAADCGDHASCPVSLGVCQCDDAWSSNADFMVNNECVLSLDGIIVLWALNLFVLCFVAWDVAFYIFARVENFIMLKRTRPDYGLWANKGLISVVLYFGISWPVHAVMCIAHFVDPTIRVGFDVLPTVCFFVAKLGFYAAAFFLQGPFLASALRGQPHQAHLVRYNYIANAVSMSLSTLLGFLPFVVLGSYQTDLDAQVVILRFYYFVQAATMLVNAIVAFLIKRFVFKILDASKAYMVDSDKAKRVRANIAAVQDNSNRQAAVQCLVYLVMGSVPFLLNKHAYFLPISWLAFPLLGRHLAKQITVDQTGARSLMQRLKLRITHTGESSNKSSEPHAASTPLRSPKAAASFVTHNPLSSHVESVTPTANLSAANPLFDITPVAVPKSITTTKKKKKKTSSNHHGSSFNSSVSDRSFADVLDKNSQHRAHFVEFMRKKYATEGLALYDTCTEFHVLGKLEAPSQKKLNALGGKICAQHLVPDAPQAVDIPDGLRKRLLEANAIGTFDPKAFDVVRAIVFNELRDNFMHQFIQREGIAREME